MRALHRKICRNEDFRPGWAGIFVNGAYLFRRGLHQAIAQHASRLHGTVVDFGCGQKPYRDLFPAETYFGIDVPVSGHPEEAKKADIFFDGRNIPLRDASVDGVLASEVFEHVFDLPATLREIHRILKPGGTLLLTCPFCWNEHEIPYDFARYTRFGLRHLVTTAGFEIVEEGKKGHFVHALAQLSLLYCNEHLRPSRGYVAALLGIFYNSFFNLFGLLAGMILPSRWDFYLVNVFVVRKGSS